MEKLENTVRRAERKTISLWLPQLLHDELSEYCTEHTINRSALVREAIVMLLEKRLTRLAPKTPLVNLDWD